MACIRHLSSFQIVYHSCLSQTAKKNLFLPSPSSLTLSCHHPLSLSHYICTSLLLHPWLVPSSGVAGIADDLIPPYCPVCCPLSDPPLSCPSYMHLSILGLAALFFFSLVCPHVAFNLLSFINLHLTRFSPELFIYCLYRTFLFPETCCK